MVIQQYSTGLQLSDDLPLNSAVQFLCRLTPRLTFIQRERERDSLKSFFFLLLLLLFYMYDPAIIVPEKESTASNLYGTPWHCIEE